jgi:hypothetical protein
MSDSSASKVTGISRRALARTLGGAAAAACLPAPVRAASEPAPFPQEVADARIDALVEAALAATPARLTPEQRLDVRRAVRDTQKTLLDVRKVALGDDVDPATVFQAKAVRTT